MSKSLQRLELGENLLALLLFKCVCGAVEVEVVVEAYEMPAIVLVVEVLVGVEQKIVRLL